MKPLFALVLVTLSLAMSGCAQLSNLTQAPLAVATHNDLLAAAALAEANGYPARAAVRRAIDAQLTACELAISAAAPKAPAGNANEGPITRAERLEEAVGSFSGIPAAAKINCAPIPLIIFPKL